MFETPYWLLISHNLPASMHQLLFIIMVAAHCEPGAENKVLVELVVVTILPMVVFALHQFFMSIISGMVKRQHVRIGNGTTIHGTSAFFIWSVEF